MGPVFMLAGSAVFFVALWHWEEPDKGKHSGLGAEVQAALGSSGAAATVSAIVWGALNWRGKDTAPRNPGGYPAMAALMVGSFVFGILGGIEITPDVFNLVAGGIATVAAIAIAVHTPKTEKTPEKGWLFVPVQAALSIAAPLILIFVFTSTGLQMSHDHQKHPDLDGHPGDPSIPYFCALGGMIAGFTSFVLFIVFFRSNDPSNPDRTDLVATALLWSAILVDIGALGSTVAAAGYLYAAGDALTTPHLYGEADTFNPDRALWLLFASATVKMVHWVVAHVWGAALNSE